MMLISRLHAAGFVTYGADRLAVRGFVGRTTIDAMVVRHDRWLRIEAASGEPEQLLNLLQKLTAVCHTYWKELDS